MKRALAIVAVWLAGLSVSGQPHALTSSPAWESIAGPAGGSVAALAMSPDYASDHTVWAGLRGHGVYRSVDGGGTWQPLGLSDQVIVDLAVSPNFAVDHTLFAATGLGASGYMVYRSTDGGATVAARVAHSDGFKPLIGLSIHPITAAITRSMPWAPRKCTNRRMAARSSRRWAAGMRRTTSLRSPSRPRSPPIICCSPRCKTTAS
jgi:hypothetical protein